MVSKNISIISLCFNDEIYIKKNIDNLSFANEVILIDNNSTDNSVVLAKKLGATVIHQNEVKRADIIKSTIESTTNNWVIVINTTDYISEDLINELITETDRPKTDPSYFAGQTLFFFGKTIKYGVFLNKKKLILFDKTRFSYSEDFNRNPPKRLSLLKNKINSFSYKNFEDFNSRLNLIRKEEALVLFQNNKKPNIYHFFMKPFFLFINQYFLKLGFLNGREGFILAYISSFSVLKRYFMLWLLYRNME